MENDNKKGYIYVLEDELHRIKIGKTRHPEKRFSDISHAAGLNINMTWLSKETYHYSEIEQAALRHFRNVNIKAEWFKCTYESAVNVIESLMYFYELLYTEESRPVRR